jgi:lipopolysaccharide biosynthesis glycosyltransferase
MREEPISIVFASNKSYAEHLAVALCSLFENNQGLSFDVYIINTDFDKASWSGLDEIANRYGRLLVDVKISDRDLEGLVTPFHLSKETYYRLFIPEKLPFVKTLYLDADIVVNGSISDLYRTDLDGYYLAAVNTPGLVAHKDLEMSENSRYFNAGIMLINVEMWRRDCMKERVIEVVRRKPWAIQFGDQCGLNSVVDGKWKELHPKFNLQSFFFEASADAYAPSFPKGELAAAIKSPVILHYSGSAKPWQFGYKHPYRGLYWKYLRKTSYNRWFSQDITIFKIAKWCIPEAVKKAFKKSISSGAR